MLTSEDREKLGDIRHCIERGGELFGWVPKWLCDKIAELESGYLLDAPVDPDRRLYRFTADALVMGVSCNDAIAVIARYMEELSRTSEGYPIYRPIVAGSCDMVPFKMPPR